MPPKKRHQEGTPFKRLKITLKTKREIIEKREQGVSVADLARTYDRSTSTICTILKNKSKIMGVAAAKGVTRISTQRLPILDDVERILLTWINEKQSKGDLVNESIICEEAKAIFADLVKKTPGSSTTGEQPQFKASRGWLEKFKRRTGILGRRSKANSDTEYVMGDIKFGDWEDYQPSRVFKPDEASPLRKKTRKGTHITEEKKALSEEKSMEDNDIDFTEEHSPELTNTDLIEAHYASQKEGMKEEEEEEEEDDELLPSDEIREMLKAWESVASYIEKHHPNKAMAMYATNSFNEFVVSHFYEILERRQNQMCLDSFLLRRNNYLWYAIKKR